MNRQTRNSRAARSVCQNRTVGTHKCRVMSRSVLAVIALLGLSIAPTPLSGQSSTTGPLSDPASNASQAVAADSPSSSMDASTAAAESGGSNAGSSELSGAVDPFAPAAEAPAPSPQPGAVHVDPRFGTVEIHVSDANILDVLRMLSLQSQTNIIASREVRGQITANLYGVTIREALDAILKSNGYVWREEGNFLYVFTQAEDAQNQQARRQRRTEIFRLSYAPVDQAQNMIKPALSKEGEVAVTSPARTGVSSGSGDTGGNNSAIADTLVITDYDENIEQVQRILAEIDRRPQQILVEATIMTARLTEENRFGIDFTILGGVDFSTVNGPGSAAPGLNTALGPNAASSANASAINERGYVGTSFGGSGLKLGVVKNNIAMFLEALETTADTALLANPKVLVLNKQKGEVRVGSELGYRSQTLSGDNTTQGTVEFLETGTSLTFRPFIGADGYIRMEVLPEESTGTLVEDAGGKLPQKQTSKVVTNILVRDGHTVVIGGLFRESSSTSRGQVPGLGSAPLIGPLFRKQTDNTIREELIVLLTPHIIKDHETYARLSAEELGRMNQLRTGVRRGMLPFGRERLAEAAYDAAVTELAKPSPDNGRAMWFLNQATNLNPKFIEAIELKQKLTGKSHDVIDNAVTRDFIRRLTIADVEKQASAAFGSSTPPNATAPVVVTPKVDLIPEVASQSEAPTAETSTIQIVDESAASAPVDEASELVGVPLD